MGMYVSVKGKKSHALEVPWDFIQQCQESTCSSNNEY